ncbi:fungal-specific transcription factor domain-containing protein [Morchella snyderi]|nr:fungal-specific transcription factor domain-containing protein [Morchella snyderi]
MTGGGTKRRRTNEGALIVSEDEESYPGGNGINPTTRTTTSSSASPPKSTLGASKEADLETRMNRLAEIVDRWYKDASTHGALSDGLATRPRLQTTGRDDTTATDTLAENGFAQSQAYLYLLQQATGLSTIDPNHSASSASPSPTHTLSPNVSITPESSIGGRSQEPENDGPGSGWAASNTPMTIKIFNEKIEAVRQSENDDVDDLGIGHLSIQGGGRSRYVGTSFWGLLSSEINELNQILKTHTHFDRIGDREACEEHYKNSPKPQPTLAPPQPLPQAEYRPGCPQAMLAMFSKASFLQFEPREIEARTCEVVPAILKSLPNKSLANHLYKSFLHGVHPVMPLLHAPTFDEDYQHFWRWYPDNQQQFPDSKLRENPTFLPLLMAVLYAGAISMSSKTIHRLTGGEWTKETISSRLYGATMSALAACAFPRSPTVNSLISFLIVQTCLIREEEPLTSCSFVGMAMRVAQSMGLHRDGSLFKLSEVECEVRRRVWWHIMYLDVQGAIATGLPPLGGSGDDLYDTKMVSELRDEYIGLAPGAPDPVTPMTPHNSRCQEFHKEKIDIRSSPAMILAVGRYESTILLRKIITRLFAIRGSKRSDLMEMGKMIYELKMSLEKKISRIPARGIPEMGFIPPVDSKGGPEVPNEVERTVVFNSWARIMLSLLSDRAFGVLYQPFLKSAKSNMWKHARNCALHFCHSFLRKFLYLSRTQLFQPYQWFCPGTYQPLHATMILILDLHQRPFALEAPKSRGFVDEVFAVFGEHGNYSTGDGEGGNRPLMEGGREAWRMLWRLRKKAYEKAGIKIPLPASQEESGTTKDPDIKLDGGCGSQQEYYPNFPQFAMDHTTADTPPVPVSPIPPPFIPAHVRTVTPPPPNMEDMTGGGSFEELLQMDTIIDAEDKAFFTDAVTAHFLQEQQSREVELSFGMTEEAAEPPPATNQFNSPAEGAGRDMMDFDWEEWDQVFGKYVSVGVGDIL